MASTFTTNVNLEKPANGDDVDFWDQPVNADWDAIDAVFGNDTTLNATGASGNVNLTVSQYRPRKWTITGTLTANVTYTVPVNVGGQWTILNSTTGAFTVTLISANGGTTVVLPQGIRSNVGVNSSGVFPVAAAAGANSDITSLNALGLTGIVKGQGANLPLVAAVAGTDYAVPANDQTWTGSQTLNGSNTKIAEILRNAAETTSISASSASGTIAYYLSAQSVIYFTANSSANFTVNLSFASTPTTLNTAMAIGQTMTCAFLVTNGATPFFNSAVQVDGTTTGVTTKWAGAAPTTGTANAIDVYTYTIIKTGSATFTVLASQSPFV